MGKTDMGEKIAQALTEMSAGKYSSLCVPSEERAPASKVDVSLVRKETAALRGRLAGLIQAARYQPSFPQKSGRRIEAGALPRLATKDPRVFRQEAEQVAVNTAVTILLDRSGSMCGDRLEVASQAALAAALALDSIPGVEVSAAAFPGSTGNNVISVMTAFGESARATAKNYGIASTGGTPTANALYWAGSRLANRPEPRKMVLVITDGDPNDLFAAIEARKTLETSKIEVFGIGIQVPTITSVFPKSRSINDVSALPSALFEVLRAELTKK
ncbi:MAG: VWA domain-containing protein [Desulfuromonas thiophila]|nr:VWA domain-containing protein [Desulfuromonas thiophila]